jgi:hypothetical protein
MCRDTQAALARWDELRADAVKLNETLRQEGLPAVSPGQPAAPLDCAAK